MLRRFTLVYPDFSILTRNYSIARESHKLVSKTLDRKMTMHWTLCTMYIMEETSRKSNKLFIKDLQILKTPLGAPVPKV